MSALLRSRPNLRTAAIRRKVPERTHAVQQPETLFDDLIGEREHRRRHFEAKRLHGLQVDHQLEFSGLLHWQIGGLCTLEDAAGLVADLVIYLRKARSVAHESTDSRELASVV